MSWPNRDRLIHLFGAGPVAVISGAGLSTGSGIPAYRDSQGQWQHSQPIQHQDFLKSAATRRRYWARSFVGWPTMGKAQPNDGHRALAGLEAKGLVSTVITQNVDGLHQAAGSAAVIELHGGIRQVRCLSCEMRFPRHLVQDWLSYGNPDFDHARARTARLAPDGDAHLIDTVYASFSVPDCPECGGMLKPDVVFFGDNVPRERVSVAQQAVETAHALLIVGSSLMVYSGYRFAEQAHRLGKPVIVINQGVTRADPLLTLKIEDDCGAVLTELAAALADESAVSA
jgi:NAD-dependent SIR2 family protein deacetylase